MKKIILSLLLFLFFASLVSAASIDIEFPNTNEFAAGKPITFKATIYDDNGIPVDGQMDITITDSGKKIIEGTAISKQINSIDVGDAASGQGVITAEFEETKAIAFFEIGREELVKFELNNNRLIVTNVGNTRYSKTISITIGNTVGTQTPNLGIGESVSYRLIAPEGTYLIRVDDGTPSSKTWGEIKLTGTGNVIGAIDDSASDRAGITGGVSPEGNDIAILSYIKSNKFVYVFIAVIFAATILIAIERQYKKHVRK